MGERYANCTVHHEMHSDRRFDLLAQLAGWSRPEACWRMVELWSRCTALQTDRPPPAEIRIHLGLEGERLLVDAALGERLPGGAIRVLGGGLTGGDTDRFGWYEPLSTRAAAGGLARAEQVRQSGRAARGRFAPAGTSDPPATDQRSTSATSDPPAISGAPPASGFRIPEEDQNSLAARAIPPSPAPTPVGYDPVRDPMAIGRLAEATYRRVSDALIRVSAELKLPAPLPFPAINPGSSERTRDARDRVREEGADAPAVCDRVVANLIAQAREERSVEWLAEKAFTPGGWRTARAWMPGAAARRRGPARGDPLPPAPPPKRPEPPPPDPVLSPEDRAELLALADRLVANPDAAAAAELARGRSPAHIATAELVRRFGEGPAPPDTPDAIANESRKPPRRKAAT
jgi:hypothetical protein